jgi:Cu(I)/Ag(I) efflux system membrane fusion protein
MPHAAKEMPVQDLEEPEKSGERSPEAKAALKKIAAIRHKLGILGLPKRDIDELMKVGDATGIATVYSSVYGQIIEQNAYEGSYVNRGTAVFIIGDPRYVWTRLDAYEADYPWLRKGQGVTFWTDAYPGELFEGKVVYIDPVFNIKTRTFSVAAISPDPGGRLKAGMLVRATIHAGLTGEGNVGNDASDLSAAPLVIPASAPLVTGKRAVVYVAVPGEEGSYEGREIVLGPRAADHYVVLGGLKEGDQVVVNGNFKIDSAVQILARSSMMSLPGGRSATEHHHHGGSDVMHEDYQSERMHSRIGGEEGLEPVPGQGMPPRVVRPDTSGTEKSFRPTINRRRPGAYGDTTRSGPETSAAGDPRQRVKREEHRSTTHD